MKKKHLRSWQTVILCLVCGLVGLRMFFFMYPSDWSLFSSRRSISSDNNIIQLENIVPTTIYNQIITNPITKTVLHQKHMASEPTQIVNLRPFSNVSFCQNLTVLVNETDSQKFQEVKGRPVFVFSAYYDNRTQVGAPVVRIIATGLQAEYNAIGSIHCIFWYKDIAGIHVEAQYDRIYQSTLYHDEYTAHFVICKLPKIDQKPHAVSVTSEPCGQFSNSLLILYPLQNASASSKATFGLCVSPIYNRYDNINSIIEFIEMHRILGVSKITFYETGIGDKLKKLLFSYAKEGIVELVQWHIPPNVRQNYFMQRESLNDCLYRNMLKVQYVAVYDLDEIIVPRSTENWSSMMKNLSLPLLGAYLFQHVYFRREPNPIRTNKEPYLITQMSFVRTRDAVPPGKIRCKSIYDAKKALKIDIHFPYQLLNGFKEHIVPPAVAVLHHYRSSPMSMFQNKNKKYEFIRDTYMTKYKQSLLDSYNRRMSQFQTGT